MRVYIPKLQPHPKVNDFAYRNIIPDPDSIQGDFLAVWSFRELKNGNWPEQVRVNWANPRAPMGDFLYVSAGVLISRPRVREIVRRSAPGSEVLSVFTPRGDELDLWNLPPSNDAFDRERAERMTNTRLPRTMYRRLAFHGSRIASELFKVPEASPALFVSDTPAAPGGLVEHVRAGAVTGLSLLEVWNDEGRDLPEYDPLLQRYETPLLVPRFSEGP